MTLFDLLGGVTLVFNMGLIVVGRSRNDMTHILIKNEFAKTGSLMKELDQSVKRSVVNLDQEEEEYLMASWMMFDGIMDDVTDKNKNLFVNRCS